MGGAVGGKHEGGRICQEEHVGVMGGADGSGSGKAVAFRHTPLCSANVSVMCKTE